MAIKELEGPQNIFDLVDRTNQLIRAINAALAQELDVAEFTGTKIKEKYEVEPNAYTDAKDTKLGDIAPQIVLTQAAYDALGSPDPTTMYIIVG